jgi:hypothetical protein
VTGVDTETHLGKAVLIATPRIHKLFPKSFEDCVQFLIDTGDTQFCCWNADYDMSAIFKFLESGVLERLFKLEKWTIEAKLPSWQSKGKIKLHYIPRKFLRIRAGKWKGEVYDLAQFYNCSLEFAAQQEFGVGKKDVGVKWSQLRAVLAKGGKRAQKIVEYCKEDARLVEELAARTKDKFEKIGVSFDRPISCASLSYHVFKSELNEKRIRKDYNEMARESFRGGMIECLRTGFFKRAYYIDLRSAYPSIIRDLFAAPHTWTRLKNGERPSDFALYGSIDCSVNLDFGMYKTPLAYCPLGMMTMYATGRWRLWLDLTSFREAEKLGWVERIYGGIQGVGLADRQPFAEKVERLYLERFTDPQKKWAVKIVLNSLYGKMAETKKVRIPLDDKLLLDLKHLKLAFDGFEEFRPHTNFFTAGEVTSRIRWRLFRDIDPKDVIFYATDGVFLRQKPGGLDFGDALGQWSPAEEVRDLVVVGSGVYAYRYLSKTGEWKTTTRFRGFNSSLDLYKILDSRKHEIPIELQRNQKLGMTVARQAWDMFNVIHMEERTLHVNFDRKRVWEKRWCASELLHRSFESRPWIVLNDKYLDPKLVLPKGRMTT